VTQIGFDLDGPAPEPVHLEPFTFRFEKHHDYVGEKKPRARCHVCKRSQNFIEHLGFPQQLDNDSGTDPMVWQSRKKEWQKIYGEALHAAGFPHGGVVESVQVIVKYIFPNRHRRDRDNLVYPFCKFFGDAMVRGRYWEIPYVAIDWSDAGMVNKKKLHRRVIDPFVASDVGDTVRLVGRTFDPKKPVVIQDPEGGFIPDDRWDRFEVIEMQAEYVKGVEAHEIMVLPSTVEPAEWPPEGA
jgi:hypothetical protein